MKNFIFTLLCTTLSLYSFAQVASYSFNNGNADADLGSINGIVNGATPTTDRFGNANHAYAFDGDDYISFGDSSDFAMGTQNYAISVWVNYNTTGQTGVIFGKHWGGNGNYNAYQIWIGDNDDFPIFGGEKILSLAYADNDSLRNPISTLSYADSNWHHIILNHHYSTKDELYIDGILVAVDSTPYNGGELNGENGFLAAGCRLNTDGASAYFEGLIDDIGIYDRVLTSQEIDSLYNAPNPVVSASTAVEEQRELAHIFPNPTSNLLNIQHPTQAFNRLEVISIDGRSRIYDLPLSQQQQINLSELQAGLYLLRIWKEGELLATKKFSKL
jgi:hypothetical protein